MIPRTSPRNLPRLHEDLPKVGGFYKVNPEDFVVEELFTGLQRQEQGRHLYIRVKKRNLSHQGLLRRIAELFQVPRETMDKKIGYAGTKDKRAVTTQWLSIEDGNPQHIRNLYKLKLGLDQELYITEWTRQARKLKINDHKGNQFRIALCFGDMDAAKFEEAQKRAQQIADRLRLRGIANFYGHQRFGSSDGGEDNADLGKLLLLEGLSPEHVRAPQMLLNAYQSQLFNDYLEHRRQQGSLHVVLSGDWLAPYGKYHKRYMAKKAIQKSRGNEYILCEDPEEYQELYEQHQCQVMGPMFGHGLELAGGLPGIWERELLAREAEEGAHPLGEIVENEGPDRLYAPLSPDASEEHPRLRRFRRSLIARVDQLRLHASPTRDRLFLSFALPGGSYATTVLNEFGAEEYPRPPRRKFSRVEKSPNPMHDGDVDIQVKQK